mmetsp:Transcript_33480/g.105390  ORF Transcript_33480/g.105390 Transcript_33480/m.105390 type:complete len:255 (-) Transcript_33480:165-929(-)
MSSARDSSDSDARARARDRSIALQTESARDPHRTWRDLCLPCTIVLDLPLDTHLTGCSSLRFWTSNSRKLKTSSPSLCGRASSFLGAASAVGAVDNVELAERASLLLLQPLLCALRVEGVQTRQRADGLAGADVLETDAASAQFLGQLADVGHGPRCGPLLNLARARPVARLLQVLLDKLAQEEQLQRRDLPGLQPADDAGWRCAAAAAAAAGRVVQRRSERAQAGELLHAARRQGHAVHSRAVRAAAVQRTAR